MRHLDAHGMSQRLLRKANDGTRNCIGGQVVDHVTQPRERNELAARQLPVQALRLATHIGDLIIRAGDDRYGACNSR